MCWWAFATALLYIAAVFIVLFCDTRAELATPFHKLTMWGCLKSWIKQTAAYRFVWQILSMIWSLTLTVGWHILRISGRWLYSLTKPRKKPPDPNYWRRKRYKETLLYQNKPMRPRRRTWAQTMAAAIALAKFP